MSYSDIFHKIIEHQDAIQSFIMFIAICFTGWQTWYLHNKSNEETRRLFKISAEEKQKDFLNSQLIELQRMSFYDPFVENEKYTQQWNDLHERYIRGDLHDKELDNFLKYDVYTEMLYNFIEMSFKVYHTSENLLKYVDFKSWVRTHKQNWQNPLKEYSNREVYGDKMCDMIDKWLK